MHRSTTVRVDDGSFLLSDAGGIAPETLDFATGLIATMSRGAMICAGIHTGYVRVDATTTAGPPTEPDASAWEEVCEASVPAPHGRLRVGSLYDGPVSSLPLLSPAGPGWYRVRACARGRDTARDAVQTEPTEDYLLVCWPAPPTTPVVLRATDRTGRGLRRSEVRPLYPPPAPTEETPSYEQLLRDNLLKRRR